jgi:hypothetical protein
LGLPGEDWFDIEGGPLARAYHLLQKIDLGPERGSERGPLLEFNIGSHPGDSTHYVNAKDMLSLSLLQARLIDLGMPLQHGNQGESAAPRLSRVLYWARNTLRGPASPMQCPRGLWPALGVGDSRYV